MTETITNPIEDEAKGTLRGNLDAPELKWENTITAVRRTRLTQPRTVALCGFAVSSRHLAPYNKKTVEIWGCNEAYNANYMKNSAGEFRADRWFQMHLEEDWSRNNNPNDKRHAEWLGKEHNFPIVMQENFKSVPNAEAFPLDECDELFFSKAKAYDVKTGKFIPWLEAYEHGYYSSSFAWMIAYAIWSQKFDVIEIWGFNMATQSEYMYQKPGAEFWVAQALARGIEIRTPNNSPIMKGHLYGYTVSDVLLPSQIRTRLEEVGKELVGLKDAAMQYHGARLELEDMHRVLYHDKIPAIADRLKIRLQAELAATARVNFYMGAQAESNNYLGHLTRRHDNDEDGWIDRLTMEVRKASLRAEIQEYRTNLDSVSGAKMELEFLRQKYINDPEVSAALGLRKTELQNAEIEWTGKLSFSLGAISQVEHYIVQSESRNPNMTAEYDYGYVVVPELYGEDIDVLKLGEKKNDTKTTKPLGAPNTGGAGGSPSESGQPA